MFSLAALSTAITAAKPVAIAGAVVAGALGLALLAQTARLSAAQGREATARAALAETRAAYLHLAGVTQRQNDAVAALASDGEKRRAAAARALQAARSEAARYQQQAEALAAATGQENGAAAAQPADDAGACLAAVERVRRTLQ